MRILKRLIQPPWRTLVGCVFIIMIFLFGYQLWTPGTLFTDGRHDRKTNGIWLQHGWLGDNAWFQRYQKNPQVFRDSTRILQLKQTLLEHHITDIYPHLAPCQTTGEIAGVDPQQAQQFFAVMDEFRIMPWVGGVLDVHVFPESVAWRHQFVSSIRTLLISYPVLAGIHVNIEPLPSGYHAYITLLQELKHQLPAGKILSVAAYPPPTVYQRSADVHWDNVYYTQVAQTVDQLAVMMYDTSIRYQKLYQQLMKGWTQDIIAWSGDTEVLLGVPAYDDEGVAYHDPSVENLRNSLLGIHAGLERYAPVPSQYKGIAIYAEWEMEQREWDELKKNFLQK